MSDNIPLDIQAEILKRLPIKSIIQFRSVSKPWKSLIDSSEFIADFNLGHIEPRDILVSYYDNNYEQKYVSFIYDNTFPEHTFPLTLPISVNGDELKIVGSSQGLFCFYSSYEIPSDSKSKTAVIWNPSIRKSVAISVPDLSDFWYATVIGFGVCPHTSDPKLVKVTYIRYHNFNTLIIPSQVQICNSKSTVWRTRSNNLPRKSIALKTEHVAIGRFIYWLGFDRKFVGGVNVHCYNLILLFDITNEEFTDEIYLPDSLAKAHGFKLGIFKLRESVVVLDTHITVRNKVYDVWMMENGVSNSFNKLYTIKVPTASTRSVLGFRKSGEPIIDMKFDYDEYGGLFVYEPDTEKVSSIGIPLNTFPCFVSSYMESLLLLDH